MDDKDWNEEDEQQETYRKEIMAKLDELSTRSLELQKDRKRYVRFKRKVAIFIIPRIQEIVGRQFLKENSI